MKKITYMLGFILGAFLMFSIVSCQQQSSEPNEKKDGNQVSGQLYYIEMAELAKSDILPIYEQYSEINTLSFSEIQTIRNTLKKCTTYDFDSMPDVSKKDCYDFLVTHGASPSETNTILNSLDERGNIILFFNSANSVNNAFYVYAEKQ